MIWNASAKPLGVEYMSAKTLAHKSKSHPYRDRLSHNPEEKGDFLCLLTMVLSLNGHQPCNIFTLLPSAYYHSPYFHLIYLFSQAQSQCLLLIYLSCALRKTMQFLMYTPTHKNYPNYGIFSNFQRLLHYFFQSFQKPYIAKNLSQYLLMK